MSNQETKTIVGNKDRREGKGRVIALSRKVYRIEKSDVFYVESETIDDMYYYVMFNTARNFEWCSCKDFERRNKKCKHLFGVEFAIRNGTVKDTDKLPENAKRDNQVSVVDVIKYDSWREDQYDF